MDHDNRFAPPKTEVADVVAEGSAVGQPAFFPVSITKLMVMSLCTSGFYEVYWFYKNWALIRDRTGQKVIPVARAIFSLLFCFQLFKQIREFRPDLESAKLAAGPLAAAFIISSILWRLPDPFWLISYASILALVPVQRAVNVINETIAPDHDRNSRFTAWNWVAVVLGGLMMVLALVGTFLPQAS